MSRNREVFRITAGAAIYERERPSAAYARRVQSRHRSNRRRRSSGDDRLLSPTIVLVHGASATRRASSLDPRPAGQGFRAVGSQPLRDLAGDASYLRRVPADSDRSDRARRPLLGGNVISTAATGNDQMRALVYFNGWMCDEGESQQQLLERFEGSLVGPSIRPVPFTDPDGSEGADLYLDPEASDPALPRGAEDGCAGTCGVDGATEGGDVVGS